MTPEMRQRVKQILREFVERTLQGQRRHVYSLDDLKREYPFQSLFFRDEALVAFKHQRSVVTKLGRDLYPLIVTAITEGRYRYVREDFRLDVTLDEGMWNAIDRIVGRLRAAAKKKGRKVARPSPDHDAAIAEILSAPLTGPMETRTTVLDVFIADFQPAPLYLELKTTKPNLDICAESKRKILAFEAFMHTKGQPVKVDGFRIRRPNSQARGYLAFPYGLRATYKHAFTQRVMDLKNECLSEQSYGI